VKVLIVGTGYVGLVTGACLAELGNQVVNVDNNRSKIEKLKLGEIPISERGLADIVVAQTKSGNLSFATDMAEEIQSTQIVFIAVGTPSLPDGQLDLSAVEAVASRIGRLAIPGTVMVVKSTVPAGTCERLERQLAVQRGAAELSVVSNPEFLREGSAVADFFAPDRIVIGTNDLVAREKLAALYKWFREKNVPFLYTDATTSELIKYAANGFLAMKITFINELAHLCAVLGSDVVDLAKGIGLDPRIGPAFLKPGPGYGGSCFPKDVLGLSALGQEANTPLRLIESVASANAHHVRRLMSLAGSFFAKLWAEEAGAGLRIFAGRRIAILGLAFKANTDDVRDSASLTIVRQLMREGADVVAYDPEAGANALYEIPNLVLATTMVEAIRGADGVIIMTEWKEFSEFDWIKLGSKLLKNKALVDFRNLLAPADLRHAGFKVLNLGRIA
jgi:UDPglucose 6-dehydrogenase